MAKALIKVEFNAGDDIQSAFSESIRLAKKFECLIEFNFNGVKCIASPSGDINDGIRSYMNVVNSKSFNGGIAIA